LQQAIVETDHSVHTAGQPFVVRRDERGAALAANQREELFQDNVGGMLVEVAGRLVRQDELGPIGQRAAGSGGA
jgi:hypothetical protein